MADMPKQEDSEPDDKEFEVEFDDDLGDHDPSKPPPSIPRSRVKTTGPAIRREGSFWGAAR